MACQFGLKFIGLFLYLQQNKSIFFRKMSSDDHCLNSAGKLEKKLNFEERLTPPFGKLWEHVSNVQY